MTGALLQVRNVESRYGPVQALRGVSMDVAEGRIVALLGANGAGKTTLLKTISGVLDRDRGEILLAGETIHRLAPETIVRRGVVHVPEGREIFPLMSVADNLALGAWTRDDDAVAADRDRVFGHFPVLRRRLDQQGGTLSGGEQQMLAIARGLMARPKVLLLDEPSLGLAPAMVRSIFSILGLLRVELGLTMLLVEQNAAAALDLADDCYVMETGRIVMEGPAARLAESRDIQEFYLGAGHRGLRGERRWKRRKTWR